MHEVKVYMELKIGTEVVDKNGKILGTVDRFVSNLSTGEIRSFMIHRKGPEKDLFFSPDDVLEVTEVRVVLKISIEELSQR